MALEKVGMVVEFIVMVKLMFQNVEVEFTSMVGL
jgi:hypothetical protein